MNIIIMIYNNESSLYCLHLYNNTVIKYNLHTLYIFVCIYILLFNEGRRKVPGKAKVPKAVEVKRQLGQ